MMEIQKMYIILIISLLLCNTSSLFSDWSPETRLTFDSGYSGNRPSNRWIACDLSENVHIVWHDNRDGNFEIYYKEKKNEAWSSDFRLTYDDSVSENPAVVIDSAGTVYVVWQDNRDGNYEIYFFEKENDSLWVGPTRLTNTNSNSLNPSISGLDWGTLHLVWQDDLDGDFEIFYKKREQSGIWNPDTQLTHTNSNCENSSIIGGEGGYILSWQDFRDGDWEIYWKFNYTTEEKLSNNNLRDEYPMSSLDSDFYYPGVYFQSDSSFYGGALPGFRIFSHGFGLAYIFPLTNWDSLNSDSKYPSADIHNAIGIWTAPGVVWQENKDGNFEIYGEYIDADLIKRISYNDSLSLCPSVASGFTPEEHIHVIWMDNRDGNFEIYYRCNYSIGVKETNTLKHYPSRKNINLQISPNPFISEVSIKWAGISHEKEVELQIYDASGRLVKSVKLTTNSCQLGADFIPGIYFLKLNGTPVGKVVKVR